MKRVASIILILVLCLSLSGFAIAVNRVQTIADLDALADDDTITKAEVLVLLDQAYMEGYRAALALGNSNADTRSVTIDDVDGVSTYILNTHTHKFHVETFQAVLKIAPENYKESTGSREDVIAMGYAPCGICLP